MVTFLLFQEMFVILTLSTLSFMSRGDWVEKQTNPPSSLPFVV